MKNICPICEAENFKSLDTVEVPCGACKTKKEGEKCPQCQDLGKIKLVLRDRKYWFAKNMIYNEPIGFQICAECGFVNYAQRWPEEEYKLKLISPEETTVDKIFVSRNKIKQIIDFIKSFDNECILENHGNILEIGCQYGLGAKYTKAKKNYFGTEYNKNLAHYAKNNFNINILTDDEIFSQKYHLIIADQIIEHQLYPGLWLEGLHKSLEDIGLLFLSVPIYFEDLRDMGYGGTNFETIYPLYHQNCFSEVSIKNLILKCGFTIIKTEQTINGLNFLCKKINIKPEIIKENVDEKIKLLIKQAQAISYLQQGSKMGEAIQSREQALQYINTAINIYPGFQDSYLLLSIQKDTFSNTEKIFEIYNIARQNLKNHLTINIHFANILKERGEVGKVTNWVKLAVDLFKKEIEINQYNFRAWAGLLHVYSTLLLDKKEMEKCANFLIENCPEISSQVENLRMIYYINECN